MPYLGSSPARGLVGTTDIDDDAVTSAKIDDATIATADIATNAIDGTLTKDALIADFSDVTITAADLVMYGDATDSNNTKRDTVQGILDLGGGLWTFIDETNVTVVSAITFTDQASGYDYLYEMENVDIASDSSGIYFEVGVDGPTYRTSGYLMYVAGVRGTGTAAGANTAYGNIVHTGEGTGSNEHLYFSQTILLDPADASTKTTAFGHNIYYNYQPLACGEFSGGRYDTAEANTCMKIRPGSGNFDAGGTIRRYKRSRT
jgi:hypothetical protein